MAKKEKQTTEDEKIHSELDPIRLAMLDFSKKNKDSFLDPKDFESWSSSTGSLILDSQIGGGLKPGVIVLGGATKGGKSSSLLEFIKNFLTMPNTKAVYYDAEGRLTDEMVEYSGLKTVKYEKDWENGSCLLKWPENYESILDGIKTILAVNGKLPKEQRVQMAFVVDSLDMLEGKEDAVKTIGEATKVGGGAVMLSKFFKKSNMVLNKLGHVLFLVRQVRETIDIDKYAEKKQNKSVGGSGPNATAHAANHIWEYQGRSKSSNIMDGDKIVGHYCKIKLKKSNKADVNVMIEYPVKHIGKNKKGEDLGRVWLEMEIADLLLQWGYVSQAGSWIAFDSEFIEELNKAGFEVEKEFKIQGTTKLRKWLEENPDIVKYLYKSLLDFMSEN